MDRRDRLTRAFLALYLTLLAALGAAGYRFYREQQERFESGVRDQLRTIADLKVAQITAWRHERIEDGALVQHHFDAIPDLRKLLRGRATVPPSAVVIDWLQAMKDHRGFQDATLLDAQGNVRLSLSRSSQVEESCLRIAREATISRQVALSDFHGEPETTGIHMSVAVPILSGQVPLGVVLLRTEPGVFLYPLIQSWPTPSHSGETLLVRREGDRVLFLNELRHRKNSALKFSLPMQGVPGPTPAAEAVAGREGVWSGVDYRGIEVLAAAKRIPDSPWSLICKVDIDEVNTPTHEQVVVVWMMLLLFVLAIAPAVGHWLYRQQSRIQDAKHELEVARRVLVEHFSYLSRHANDIILLEEESGQIVEANQRAEEAHGYDREELLGLNIRDLLTPESRAELAARWEAAAGPGGVVYETLHLRKDGSSFPVEVSARVITADGRVLRQAIIRDITERRNNEERIRRAGAYNRGLIEAALDPLVTISPTGMITDANRATETVTGYPREQLVGTDFSDYFTDPDKARVGYLQAFRDGQVQDHELEIRHCDGHITPVMYSATVYRDKKGDVAGVFAAARDITERKRIQAAVEGLNQELEQRVRRRTIELEAANKELEAFTYSVSHDLRAPLRAINGFSRILSERYLHELSAEPRHYLELVRQSALKMGNLIDDLLALSRLGRQALKVQTVAPGTLARQALEELGDQRESRQIEVAIGELPPCEADPALLRQVFVNLLSNALKYSREREIARIEVGSLRMEDLMAEESSNAPDALLVQTPNPASWVYYVRDNGIGFDMRYASKLFGVFERLHSQTEFEGSGVGLAIVDRIIRRHRGRIWARSEPDKGATVYFTVGGSA